MYMYTHANMHTCTCVCTSSFALLEYLFADDTALVCSFSEDMMLAARTFDEVATVTLR